MSATSGTGAPLDRNITPPSTEESKKSERSKKEEKKNAASTIAAGKLQNISSEETEFKLKKTKHFKVTSAGSPKHEGKPSHEGKDEEVKETSTPASHPSEHKVKTDISDVIENISRNIIADVKSDTANLKDPSDQTFLRQSTLTPGIEALTAYFNKNCGAWAEKVFLSELLQKKFNDELSKFMERTPLERRNKGIRILYATPLYEPFVNSLAAHIKDMDAGFRALVRTLFSATQTEKKVNREEAEVVIFKILCNRMFFPRMIEDIKKAGEKEKEKLKNAKKKEKKDEEIEAQVDLVKGLNSKAKLKNAKKIKKKDEEIEARINLVIGLNGFAFEIPVVPDNLKILFGRLSPEDLRFQPK